MKKKALLLVLSLSFLFISGCAQEEQSADNVVNIYNWGEYIDPELVSAFEEETGIQVIYSYFTTNEDLYVKLKNGGSNYDLIFPSDYMLERMIREKMVQKPDFTNIPNRKYIDSQYLNLDFDPKQEYSLPYFWGTLGIVYNMDMVKEPVDSWDILWDPKYTRDIVMLDSSRDSIGVALLRRGYSLNSQNMKEIEEAKADLKEQFPLVYAYLVDQIRDLMKNNEAAMAVMFSGDAVDALMENERLAYAIPKEGSNLWVDCFAIPTGAKNKENAETFINFMLRPENAAQNGEWVGYSLPSSEARELLSEEYRESEVGYPNTEVLERLEVYRDPGDFIRVYDNVWQDIKNH